MGLALDELKDNSDKVYQSEGLNILLDERVSGYIDTMPGITLDYVDTMQGSGFVFEGVGSC